MKTKFHLAMLGSAALVLSSSLSALASPGTPIVKIPIGLEGDPRSVIVARTQTDADGKFEFKGLKAGNYRLVVLPSGSTTAKTATLNAGEGVDAQVRDGAQLQRTFTITVTPVNDAPTFSIPINHETGQSSQAIVIAMDGGTISGVFKIADNESPRPLDRKLTDSVTTVVGKFVSYKNGKLILLVSAMEGEEPQLTEFGRVTTVVVDPTDPMAVKTLPAEEAFRNLPVGTPVKVETNEQGSIIAILVGLLLPKTADANPQGSTKATADPNAWRFKLQNGEWLYYGVDKKWLVHRNGKWTPYQAAGGTLGTSPRRSFQDGNASPGIFDRWGNRVGAPRVPGNRVDAPAGQKFLPMPR